MDRDLAGRVRETLERDREEFEAGVAADAEALKRELNEGTFDNSRSTIGLEYEFYAVETDRWAGGLGRLARVPRRVLDLTGFEAELGLHNAEMSTTPQPLNGNGIRAQEREVLARLEAALNYIADEGMCLVSDALWTIPPAGETAREYLTASDRVDGVVLATNMTESVRYHAMGNGPEAPEAVTLDAPNVDLSAPTVLPESLITSIQPHYQVATAANLPERFGYALRVAGPLLALAANSPFFPPDLYATDDAERVIAEAHAESRIGVFESALNRPDAEKVRFPRDVSSVAEAVERLVDDPQVVPTGSAESSDRFDDSFARLRHKNGSFWRWVRPVFGGSTRSAANVRIEFRPIGAQPTVGDSIAFHAAFAGLMQRLPSVDHPVAALPWERARENFYAAARDGITSDQHWITADGEETTLPAAVYEDLFARAVEGLCEVGLDHETAERYVAPLRARVQAGVDPATWKRNRARERAEAGADIETAVLRTQRDYIERQRETLLEGTFADWVN
ncbi:MAG: hypothetical protein ABEJ43_00450 [Haloferacaceae archaeon]